MKYFSRGWANGEYDDDASERLRSEYWERIAALQPTMPPAIAELAAATELHDGLVDRALWDPWNHRLVLELVGGAPSGYFDLCLTYHGAQLSRTLIDILAERARDRRTELLYDEVDREEDGMWSHRILFWPTGEITIVFSDLELTRVPRADKRWKWAGGDPYVLLERGDDST